MLFKNIISLENLKSEYRKLAKIHHPDAGGTKENMQLLNAEYDMLFPIWQRRQPIEQRTKESASSTRSEFYTQYGWKGDNYSGNMSTKEITKIVREYVKEIYPTYKFSVTFESYSGGSSINVALMEAPHEVFKTNVPENGYIQSATSYFEAKHWDENRIELTELIIEVLRDIKRLVDSYRYDDSDAMIDYFSTNFYYRIDIGKWDKPFKVVERQARVKTQMKEQHNNNAELAIETNSEYEITEDIHTQTGEKLYIVKIKNKLSRDEYIQVNAEMKSKGGYYSKFKHGFVFKEDPAEMFNDNSKTESKNMNSNAVQSTPNQNSDRLIDKIDSQVTTLQKKIDSLSGDYKTNTYKRMREQEGRESKIQSMQIDINMLEYVRSKILDNNITELEMALIVGAFREEIHIHYLYKYGSQPRKPEFPQIRATAGQWYNDEVPKRQTRLRKAGINNSTELEKAVDEYQLIYDECRKLDPITEKQRQIKKLESEYKLHQKGDINFTPATVAIQMVELATLDENSIVLEPSAGIGNIADEIRKVTQNIDCCEYMTHFQELLRIKGYNVVGDDFLQMQKYNYYDAIIMNPPFSKNQDIEHLQYAYKLLKDGGRLVCITSPHWTFARDRASIEFRNWMENITYDTIDLESGTFEMTGVSSKIVVIFKDEQAQQEAV